MTSASELFYTRRSRYNRSPDPGLGFHSPSHDRDFHSSFYRRQGDYGHGRRRDVDACDPSRRPPHFRYNSCRRFLQPDSGFSRFDQGSSQPASSNNINAEHRSSISSGLSAHNRLPGSVLLARERLLERLRGVSVSGNRRTIRNPPGIGHRQHEFDDHQGLADGVGHRQHDHRGLADGEGHRRREFDDHWRLADVGDWGTEALMHSSGEYSDFVDLTFLSERTAVPSTKKPPGLTQDMVDSLPQETFCLVVDTDIVTETASQECSICLETYINDDKLTRLPCEHRFHSACLDPWIRTCGDCPCCRKGIIIHTDRTILE